MVMGDLTIETDVLVIGGGPGGYAAAFRAADLGLDVTMVDTAKRPGGECLFRGCIPLKTLLYLAELIHDAGRAKQMGLVFGEPEIDLARIRKWKQTVIDRLADGLVKLAEKRGVQRVKGRAVFESADRVRLHDSDAGHIRFRRAILAVGSSPIPFPGVSFTPKGRIMDSATALALSDIPETLLVVGGGYTGLELGSVYAALGSRVTAIEKGDRLIPGADADLVKPLMGRLESLFDSIHFNTTLAAIDEKPDHVAVDFEGKSSPGQRKFDRILLAMGRRPNTTGLGLKNTEVALDENGFVLVDDRMRSTDSRIFAVGDVVGGYMLAHKAGREGKVAAEVLAGKSSAFDARAIPAVVYTDPQVAWCGLTEQQAEQMALPVEIRRFPWRYSGRAQTMDVGEGMTKIIAEPETQRILGIGVCGRDAEGLIAEGVLAVEMGALVEDLALTIHAHPTLSETESEAAEIFLGGATHMLG